MTHRIAKQLIVLLPALTVGCSDDDGSDQPNYPAPSETSLAGTGLYQDAELTQLAEGVVEFAPRFELWSDGATKRRYAWLPEGSIIDTGDPDAWVYPVGARFWKEFTRDNTRVETRMLRKKDDGSWEMAAYAWNDEQTAAEAVPAGVSNALGTAHDIPNGEQCGDCHGSVPERVLGFSAIQLAHSEPGSTLASLGDDGHLSHPIANPTLPGDETGAAALGYLHANCGNCHNDRSENPLRLWLKVGLLDSMAATPTHTTTIGVSSSSDPLPGSDGTLIVEAGDPDRSLLHQRMIRRGPPGGGMPWLGSEVVDAEGSALIADWIRSL